MQLFHPRLDRQAQRQVDRHVGARVRELRQHHGLSQTALGEALGISFQQVQKYETGANRVSASRLYQVAALFEAEPGFFFEGLDRSAPARSIEETHAGLALARACARLEPDQQRAMLSIVKAMKAGGSMEAAHG